MSTRTAAPATPAADIHTALTAVGLGDGRAAVAGHAVDMAGRAVRAVSFAEGRVSAADLDALVKALAGLGHDAARVDAHGVHTLLVAPAPRLDRGEVVRAAVDAVHCLTSVVQAALARDGDAAELVDGALGVLGDAVGRVREAAGLPAETAVPAAPALRESGAAGV